MECIHVYVVEVKNATAILSMELGMRTSEDVVTSSTIRLTGFRHLNQSVSNC